MKDNATKTKKWLLGVSFFVVFSLSASSRFVPAPMKSVVGALEVAGVGPNDIVYDLGSGDGRIVITAVKRFKAKRAVGIEQRQDLVDLSIGKAIAISVADEVGFIHGNLHEVDVSEATVIFIVLGDDEANQRAIDSARKWNTRARYVLFGRNKWKGLRKLRSGMAGQEPATVYESY